MALVSSKPGNVPSVIGVAGGAPQNLQGVALFLSQLVNSVNGWISGAAQAINYLLDNQQNPVETGVAVGVGSTISPVTVGATYYALGFGSNSPGSVITCTSTGRVVVIATGTFEMVLATSQNATANFQLYTGTGTPPTHGNAITGTTLGNVKGFSNQNQNPDTMVNYYDWTLTWYEAGVSLGTPTWFDVGVNAATGNTGSVDIPALGSSLVVFEI